MKEYLDPNCNYELCLSNEDLTTEGMIEVPEGALTLTHHKCIGDNKDYLIFWKGVYIFSYGFDETWYENEKDRLEEYFKTYEGSKILWQRGGVKDKDDELEKLLRKVDQAIEELSYMTYSHYQSAYQISKALGILKGAVKK